MLLSGERTTATTTALLITTTACAAATNTPVAATAVALIVEHTLASVSESSKAAGDFVAFSSLAGHVFSGDSLVSSVSTLEATGRPDSC